MFNVAMSNAGSTKKGRVSANRSILTPPQPTPPTCTRVGLKTWKPSTNGNVSKSVSRTTIARVHRRYRWRPRCFISAREKLNGPACSVCVCRGGCPTSTPSPPGTMLWTWGINIQPGGCEVLSHGPPWSSLVLPWSSPVWPPPPGWCSETVYR